MELEELSQLGHHDLPPIEVDLRCTREVENHRQTDLWELTEALELLDGHAGRFGFAGEALHGAASQSRASLNLRLAHLLGEIPEGGDHGAVQVAESPEVIVSAGTFHSRRMPIFGDHRHSPENGLTVRPILGIPLAMRFSEYVDSVDGTVAAFARRARIAVTTAQRAYDGHWLSMRVAARIIRASQDRPAPHGDTVDFRDLVPEDFDWEAAA